MALRLGIGKKDQNKMEVGLIYHDRKSGLYLPERGQPRASGYSEAGASHTRRAIKGFTPRSSSPREDIDWNNATLRQRGRMLYMSSAVATSAINTNRTKIVGMGLTLKSTVNRALLGLSPQAAKEWQRRTEAEFYLWASRKDGCDATGMNSFEEMQQLALVSWLVSGDVFPLFKRYEPTQVRPYALRIHLLEADRVSTPAPYRGGTGYIGITDGRNPHNANRIFDGVEVDENGMVDAYHVCNVHPWQVAGEPPEWIRVEAYGKNTGLPNILHVMSSERPDQYRGVTYLAQVIEPLLQLRRYTESELMAALVQSFFTAWIVTKTDTEGIPFNQVGGDGIAGIPGDHTDGRTSTPGENEYEMGPGTVAHLEDGEDVKFGSPNIPTTGFDAFVKTFCRLIGAGLELPYDVLMKEYNSSYSAARGALQDAWEAFKMRRAWFIADFCQPVYEVWLAEAVARGRVKAPGFFDDPLLRAAWCGARWIGPVQAALDPLKEVKAAVMQVQRGFKTHEQITREMGGGDWEDNMAQLTDENTKLSAANGGTADQEDERDEEKEEDGEGGAM